MYFYNPVEVLSQGTIQNYSGDSMIVWEPGAIHHYGNQKEKWAHTWFHVKGGDVAQILSSHNIPLNKVFKFSMPFIVEKYLKLMNDELNLNVHYNSEIIENFFINSIKEIARVLHEHRTVMVPERVLKVKLFLEEHYSEDLSLDLLSDRFNMSISRLSAEFKKHIGTSPIDYLIKIRMSEAALILSRLNLNVSEVAEKVGYDDPFYFSKLFKKYSAKSPLQYRKVFIV
jgi:YesN/AraC family two-component response regulator